MAYNRYKRSNKETSNRNLTALDTIRYKRDKGIKLGESEELSPLDKIRIKRNQGIALSKEAVRTDFEENSLTEIDRTNRHRAAELAIELARKNRNNASSNSNATNIQQPTAGNNRVTENKPKEQTQSISQPTVSATKNTKPLNDYFNDFTSSVDANKNKENYKDKTNLGGFTMPKAGDERVTEQSSASDPVKNFMDKNPVPEGYVPEETTEPKKNAFQKWLEGGEKSITEEESLNNAYEDLSPYLNDKEVMDAIKKISDYNDVNTNNDILGALSRGYGGYGGSESFFGTISYVNSINKEEEAINKIMEKTGLSRGDAYDLVSSYSYLKHYREYLKEKGEIKEADGANIFGWIASRATAPIRSILAGIGSMQEPSNPRLGRDYHSPYFALSDLDANINEAAEEDIDKLIDKKKHERLNHVAKLAYKVPGAVGDSLATQSLGSGGFLTFAPGAFAEGRKDAENRGLSQRQATIYGSIVGISEAATESIPFRNLGNLLRKGVAKETLDGSIKPFAKALFKQGLEEGGEEVANDIIDLYADKLINGDKSKLNQKIEYYMSEEYAKENNIEKLTREEAEAIAYEEEFWSVVDDFVLGFASGEVSASVPASAQLYSETKTGRDISKDTEYIDAALNNKESADYISEEESDYASKEEYEQAQHTRELLQSASDAVAEGGKLAGKKARELYENVSKAQENRIKNAATRAEETAISNIQSTSTPLELETVAEQLKVDNENINKAIEVKKAELISQGATESDFSEALTPRRVVEKAIKGEEISSEALKNLPEQTQIAYEYGKIMHEQTIGKDISKADVTDVWVEDAKQERQQINKVKFNTKGELTFVTNTGKEVNAYDAKYSTEGKKLYKSENGILSLSDPSLIQIAIDAEAESNHSYPVASLTQAIKTFDTLGRTQGVDFETALSGKKYMESIVGREVLEQAFNAHRDTSTTFDEAKKTGAVKVGHGIIATRTEENADSYDRQFDNEDITAFINNENENRQSLSYKNLKAIKNDIEKAKGAFEDMSEAQKLFLEAFSKKTKVDFDFIYSEEGDTRGAYQPSKGKIILNLAHGKDIFEVALHEGIGEFLQAHNAKGYNAITTSILNYYAATQTDDLAENIRAYQAAYNNRKYRESFNEMANDAMGKIFSTDEGLTELINWLDINETTEQAKTVKKTFLDYFNSFKDMISNILKQGGLRNQHIKDLKIARQESADYAKQLLEAMNEAIKNRDVSVGQNGNSEARLSLDIKPNLIIDEIEYIEYVFSNNKGHIFSTKDGNIGIRNNRTIYIVSKADDLDTSFIPERIYDVDISEKNPTETTRIMEGIEDYERGKNKNLRGLNIRQALTIIFGYSSPYIQKKDMVRVYGDKTGTGYTKFQLGAKGEILRQDYTSSRNITNRRTGFDRFTRYNSKYNVGTKLADATLAPSQVETAEELIERAKKKKNDTRKSINIDSLGRELSDYQQKYFADSKVLDENGNLRVVYHGTMADFTIFDLNQARDTEDIEAFFFSGDYDESNGYGNVGEYYLNITNPADYDTAYDIFNKYKGKEHAGRLAREELQSLGYDGVIAVDEDAPEYTEYLVFESKQIKKTDNLNPTKSADIRYSKKIDTEYDVAYKANDTEKMQQLVEQAARAAGFDSPMLYHGTSSFGFTSFDLDKMDDKQTIFLTNNNNIASTYSGTTKNKTISEKFGDIDSIPNDKLADALNSVLPDDGTERHYEYFNQKDIKALRDKSLSGIKDVFKSLDNLLESTKEEKALKAVKRMREIQMLFSAEDILNKESINKDFSTMLFMATHHTETFKDNTAWKELEQLIRKSYALTNDVNNNEKEFIVDNYLDGYLFDVWTPKEARVDLKENVSKGNYSLYAKLGDSLVIDAEGKNWNNLRGWSKAYTSQFNKDNTILERVDDSIYLMGNNGEILRYMEENEHTKPMPDDTLHQHMLNSLDSIYAIETEHLDTTRDIVKFARQKGYNSVVFKNIRDNGGRNYKIDYDELADVYALFNPNDVKSADPATYDNNGNVIPLSERFNVKDNDLRYSKKVDSEGNKLSEEQQQYFKDSKVVDENGNLLVLYHGSKSDTRFNVFDMNVKGAVNGRAFGDGYYFTPFKDEASSWGDNNIYKVYVNIKKPYYANKNSKVPADVKKYITSRVMEIREQLRPNDYNNKLSRQIEKAYLKFIEVRDGYHALEVLWNYGLINEIKNLGYDGIIYNDVDRKSSVQYVAFYPNQIKSVDNLNPTEKEDIRYSKAVFGESSQYAQTLQQSEYVSKILSTLNNQLKGTTVSMRYIDDTVKYILDKYKANLNADELKMELSEFIGYMTANENVDYNQMMNYLMNIGDEVIEASELKDPESERVYNELKNELASHKLNLTEVERKELIAKFGGDWQVVFGKLNSIGIKLDTKNGQHMDAGLFSEISEQFRTIAGVYLDESTTPVDQVATIIDAMDALTPSNYGWEGANNMDKALDVAMTIIDRYYSMASSIKESNIVKGTEKGSAAIERAKQAEIKDLRAKQAEWKAKLNEEFQSLVEDKKKMIQEQQEFYRRQAEIERKFKGEQREFNKKVNMSSKEIEKTAKMQAQIAYQGLKDTEAKRKHKDNIVRTCTRLINWMNKPTDARHVPSFLKPALSDMIKSINFMPASMRKGNDGTISAMKWQEAMRKLQNVIQSIEKADSENLNDADKYQLALVMESEEIVAKMQRLLDKYSGTADISLMSNEDLKVLSNIMSSISNSISKMNANFMNKRFAHVSEAATAAIDEMSELRPVANNTTKFKDNAQDFLNLSMAEPITFFEELGDASSSIMQEFYDGEKIGIDIIREAEEFFNNLSNQLGLKTKDIRKWEKDIRSFNIDNHELKLTIADIMSLYCSYHREKLDQQNRPFEATHHISAGGIKAYKQSVGTRKVLNKNAQVVHPTEGQVMDIINSLSETQKQYADAVVKYMSTTLAAHGNETSNKLNGYSKYLGDYYFPLKTDANTHATTEANNATNQASLRNVIFPSLSKSQIDKADNALVVMNFFDVVTEHITDMSNYCAYSMPVSDALRWYNYSVTERNNTDVENEYQRYTTTLKDAITRVHGDGAKKYFETFIRDVNLNPVNQGDDKAQIIVQKLTGLAKAKAVGLNIRVIVQQPCAIIRAENVIEKKYLVKGWLKMTGGTRIGINEDFKAIPIINKQVEYAQSKSYLCYWKSKGLSDTRISQGMKEIITGQDTVIHGIVEATGYLAGAADDITWCAMYLAAEEKVKATTDLQYGTAEFDAAVEEIFSDIINHTQVIDSQLRKTATMRSKDWGSILMNAFKKEPQKTYNMLHRAKWNQIQAKYSQDKGKIKAANKAWAKTFAIFIENAFVTAIAQSLVDAWRDDEDEEYWLKILQKMFPYESKAAIDEFVKELSKPEKDRKSLIKLSWKLMQGVLAGTGNILENADILSAMPGVSDIISGLKGYQVQRLDDTAVLSQINDTIQQTGSSTATPYSIVYSLSKAIGYFTGIGADNALRDLRGIYNEFFSDTTGYRIEKSTKDAKKREKAKKAKELSASFDSGKLGDVTDVMNQIHDDAIESGKDQSESWGAVRDSLKEEYINQANQGKESQAAIDNRFKTLLKKTKYDKGSRYMTDKEIDNAIKKWHKAIGIEE